MGGVWSGGHEVKWNPAVTATNVLIGAAVVGGGWVALRMIQRRRLVALIENDPKMDFLDAEQIASERILLTNTIGCGRAYKQIKRELPELRIEHASGVAQGVLDIIGGK